MKRAVKESKLLSTENQSGYHQEPQSTVLLCPAKHHPGKEETEIKQEGLQLQIPTKKKTAKPRSVIEALDNVIWLKYILGCS